ncbi:zinc-binding metallopeptidase family protein [Xanthobacter pseudotagetidis]|uniref:zinc-binding metallopeptidase family protein n=1 Tax=Xanthobacter pseudotagetidis TaxID=3119911 RepID=UPI0037283640
MRLFQCEACGQLIHFENRVCGQCGHPLGYLPDVNDLSAVEPEPEEGIVRSLSDGQRYRFCANAALDACNWLVPEAQEGEYCRACRHNRTVPDLSVPVNMEKWHRIERAKHRLIYSLLQLCLPLESNEDREGGLCFDFLADRPDEPQTPRVMTGHDEGLITIALAEADDVERERRRTDLGEPYRTLLGHFRHEVGHYYWNRLVRDQHHLDACRAVFGDERADYGEALKAHYENGPPPDWQANFVSSYATSHPWEDFAETFKHYVHIVDTLEMAQAFGMKVRPSLDDTGSLQTSVEINPYQPCSIEQLVDDWTPLTVALNSLNRCLGMADAYPFVLTPAVVGKLGFINDLVHGRAALDPPQPATPPEAEAPPPTPESLPDQPAPA